MRRLRNERGVAAIVVAIIAVVLFGMGAVVVDVAALFQERRVLQNGADAAALAIAQLCGAGDCGSPTTSAAHFADVNAGEDGASAIDELCGVGVTGASACSDPPAVPAGAGYVRVRTTTDDGEGGGDVSFFFARLLGFDGRAVSAKAVAAWGGPSSVRSEIPVTMSQCEYDAYTSDGLAEEPYDSALEAVIYLHDSSESSPCDAGPAGSDLPGGFGWLDDPDDDCLATTDTEGWVDADTGNAGSRDCLPDILDTIIHIPIFDETNGLTGDNGEYHMAGFAAFYVTGYRAPSVATSPAPCAASQTCISGYFVNDPHPVEGEIGGPSMGVLVVDLIG
jgi:hypothetical protein